MKRFLLPLILSLLLIAPAVHAQTAEPLPEATPAVVTVNVPGTTINVAPAEVPAAPPIDTSALAQFGLYFLLAIAGGGSFALVLTRLDKRGLDALEKAYESTSPATQARILDIVNILADIVKVGQVVTDGKPNDVPPSAG